MILDFYQHLPQIISPIAFSIGLFDVRWYSLSYILGFFVTFLVLNKILLNSGFKKNAQIFNFEFLILNKKINFKISNLIMDFLILNFFAALIGGRLGYVLIYDFAYFISHPLSIVSPFADGKLVGFYGMSYHGALLSIVLASYIFTRYKKIDFLKWADLIVPAATIGYFFGRLGNFLNGELYGRITTSKLGMYFLADPRVLRHPSQLYEAIGEGLILFLLILKVKKIKLPEGSLLSLYLMGYSIIRFVLEFFRQPDKQIGYYFDIFTLGQILSLLMFIAGMILFFKVSRDFSKSE